MRQSIQKLRALIASFNDIDFGDALATPECNYKPSVTPPDEHPRIGFTKNRIEKLKADIDHEENRYAKRLIYSASDIEFDGIPTSIQDREVVNNVRIRSGEFHFIILSKAIRYALSGDERYGYEAIYALMNLLKYCDRDFDVSYEHRYHISLTMAKLMQTTAYVYDWCYSLLGDDDKRRIVCAATGKASQGLEYKAFPPKRGGGVCGHQSGPPYLQGWFPLTLAIYGEYPIYYNHIAELIFETIVPGQNYSILGGAHPQGVAYGSSRMHNMMFAECFFSGMFDGKRHLFSDRMEDVALDFINCIRPDGENLRIGDDFLQGTRYSAIVTNALLGSWIYRNSELKGFAKARLADFSIFHINEITPIEVLLYNDVNIEAVDPKPPLASYASGPLGRMIVRTKDSGIGAGMVYMKIGESYSTNHEHKDAGDFQIYYDGPLITSSGAYLGYGCEFDLGYYKQTVSKNCPLIYNPNMKDNGKWIYSGGQKIAEKNCAEPQTLEQWQASDNFRRAKVLNHGYKVDCDGYKFSYLCGDISNAYDAETVSEAKRHFFNLMTNDPAQPMIHVIFDRITSVDESYKKTLLLHTVSKPLITENEGRPIAVVTNLRRRLIIQSLLSEVEYLFVGDESNRCPVNGRSIPLPPPDYPEGLKVKHNTEMGLGRIEITPKKPSKTDLFITVMYVDPDTDYSPYIGLNSSILNPLRIAEKIVGDNYVGALIKEIAVIFPSSGERFYNSFSLSLPKKVKDCYIIGLSDEKWSATGAELCEILNGAMHLKPTSKTIDITK